MARRRSPILVTGSHRSGTTWVGRTLALSRSVEYVQEPFNLNFASREFGHRFDTWFFSVEGTPEEAAVHAAFDRLLRAAASPPRWGLLKIRGRRDLRAPLSFVKHTLRAAAARPRLLFKDPIALLSAGWLHECFEAEVICMIRNPLAFVGSLKKWSWDFPFDHLLRQKRLMTSSLAPFTDEIEKFCSAEKDVVDQACLLWRILHHVILGYRDRYPNWSYLRYEDLAENPEASFEPVFDRLGLSYTPGIRRRIVESSSEDHDPEADSPSFRPRDVRGSLETWRTRLSDKERSRVVESTRSLATAFYRLEGDHFVT